MDRLIPWLRRSGWAYLVLAVALALLAWRVADRTPGSTQPDAARPVVVTPREPTELLVHVAGAVRKPGVYRIAGDGRVIQAIRLAGGPTPAADLGLVNLAAPLQDGQQVLVPGRLATAAAGAGAAGGVAATGPVSLSSATAEQLDALDGITDRRSRRASSRGARSMAGSRRSISSSTCRASARHGSRR